MKYYSVYAAIALLAFLLSVMLILAVKTYGLPISIFVAISLFFSVGIPVTFLFVRNEIRNNRIHAAEVFRRTFEGCLTSNSYFEFIERKYYSGISRPSITSRPGETYRAGMTGWLSVAASIPYIILTAAGISALILPTRELAQLTGISMGASVPYATDSGASFLHHYENAFTIAFVAFASAFLYSLRLFFNSLIAYSPFGIAFLRAFAHILFAVIFSVMLWQVAPDAKPLTDAAVKLQNAIASDNNVTARPRHEEGREPQTSGAAGQISKLWLMLALAAGFAPDYAFSWLLQRISLTFNRRYSKASKHAALTPLTVIDGIDFAKAFRLEQGDIFSVQNLAMANPVMVHVETSHSIFLVMDWIGQAQLCAAVGPERFLLFRKINIRTIFDLERAVLDASSPVGLKQIAGAVLLANDAAKTSPFRHFGARPLDLPHRDFDKALVSWVNTEVIEQVVRIIVDSLHVARLRQLRRDLDASLLPARSGKEQPGGQRALATAVAPAQPNGSGRDVSLERAAAGNAMQTELHGD